MQDDATEPRPERARDRTRALPALVLGAVVVLAGALGRLVPPEAWRSELLAVSGALVASAILTLFLARPRDGQWISIGAAPLAAGLGLAMWIIALFDAPLRPQLLPAAVAASGGATVIAAFVRWALAASAHLHPRLALDPSHRYAVTHAGEKAMRPARAIKPGDRVEVPRGHVIPVDGVIEDGLGFADERALTRSEASVSKAPGGSAMAGTTTDIEMLVLTARSTTADSAVAQIDRRAHELLDRVAHHGDAAGGFAWAVIIAATGVVAALAATALSYSRGPGVWMPAAAGALLAAAAGAPLATHRRALARAVSRAFRRGIVPKSPRAVVELASTRRWQVDPRLLAASGTIDFVGEVDPVIPVAAALLEGHEGPEVKLVRGEVAQRGLRPRVAAAVRKGAGVWHGTVSGERWCLGPIRAVTEEARVEVPRTLQGSLQFLEERSAITWLLAKTGDEVVGAIGIQLLVEPDVAKAARALHATVMPGSGDSLGATLATAAQIERDGPPLGARDASLVAPGSPAPSAGLVVEVVEPAAGLRLSAPVTAFVTSLESMPAVIEQARQRLRRARWAGIAGGLLPLVACAPLAALHVLDPVLATIAATASMAMAVRATEP